MINEEPDQSIDPDCRTQSTCIAAVLLLLQIDPLLLLLLMVLKRIKQSRMLLHGRGNCLSRTSERKSLLNKRTSKPKLLVVIVVAVLVVISLLVLLLPLINPLLLSWLLLLLINPLLFLLLMPLIRNDDELIDQSIDWELNYELIDPDFRRC